MAMREIPDEEYTPKSYFKFKAVGDKFVGIYQSFKTGQYGIDYTFLDKNGTETVVTANKYLDAKLKKAELVKGNKVLMEYTGDKDIGKESPMKLIKVVVDDTISNMKPKAPAPKPAASDDIPF